MRFDIKNFFKPIIFFVTVAIIFVTSSKSVRAEFSAVPATDMMIVNGTVSAVVASSTSGVYLGGTFTNIGAFTGYSVPIVTSTGLATTSTYAKVSSDVYAVVLDGSGGWYVGGAFTQVDSYTRNYVAHILSNGTVDTNFDPNLNGLVYTLALSPDGTILYIGGAFTTVGGVTYNRLAAVSTSNGAAVSAFNPNINSDVKSLAVSSDGAILYAGGAFTTVGGVTYNRLAAVSTSNGAAISAFNPNISASVNSIKLTPNNATLYFGGDFTTVGVTTRNYIAAVTTSDGALVAGFNPNLDSYVFATTLSSDGSKLYIGGAFTTVGGVTYNRLAAVSTSNGAAISAFNPSVDSQVQSLSLTSDDATLYFGGYFNTVAGTTRNYIAAVTASNGALVSGFNPNMSDAVQSVVLSADNASLYTGGFYPIVNGFSVTNLAHILPSGAVDTNFAPAVGSSVLSLALSPNGGTIYAGGSFTTVGVATYNRLAAFSTSNGAVVSAFNPNMGGTVNGIALSNDGSTLYAGGAFTTVGGVTYNRLAAVSTSNGAAVSAFNPNVGNTIFAVIPTSDSSKLYFGGQFTTVGGVTYNRLAAVSTSNGAAVSAFNPNVGNTVRALAITPDDATLYFGGQFTTVGGVTYNRLAAVSTSNGAAVSAFNPNVGGTVNSLAVNSNSATLYVGGAFTTVGGVTYNRLAAVSTSNGAAVSAFNPNVGNTVNALALITDNSRLYAGGLFSSIGGTTLYRIRVAKFITSPTVTTSAASSVAANAAILNGSITISNTETVRGFEYGTDSSFATVVATTSENGSFSTGAFSASASSLSCNTQYYVRSYASNAAGTGYGSSQNFTTTACVPDAPTDVTATAGNLAATVSFTVPTLDGGATITGYIVTSSPDNVTASGSTSPISVTGLINNVTYTFTVVATNSAGNSAASSPSSAVTPSAQNVITTSHSGGGGSIVKKKVVVDNATSTYGLGSSYEISVCESYLKTFISKNEVNERSEVAKLQSFLVIYEKETLDISGIYDQATIEAVNRFQAKNIDVLKFWGLTSPTGNVYITTKNAINKKYCEQTKGVSCPYFTQYAKMGDNGLQVTRIKNFLNKTEDTHLNVSSQDFDLELVSAIRSFQTKYMDRVLIPWGLRSATGNWYQSTSKQANDRLGCFNSVRLDNGVVIE